MPTKTGLLARFFGRAGKHPVVSQLYTHALGQPLMVHPGIGERLIGAYLSGAVDVPGELSASSGSVAVLRICGALVNHPMPGICGPGPASYVAIRNAFDEAMADDNVKAVVLWFDSPGGMVSGAFDLSDHIFASRGKKPIHAQIDDAAYSAAYLLASACDSIQTTRTGGGGSIGVYTYHIDYSGANAKAGAVVTYIYAGEKKVDGNSDEPLSDSARTDAQARVDKWYGMFTESVAKYRGMDVKAVVDTQAGYYHGGDLILVGLADSVGTLDDLLASISAPAEPDSPADTTTDPENDMPENTPTTAPTDSIAAPALSAEQTTQIALGKITQAVIASGLAPTITAVLLDAGANVTPETVGARIEHARTVTDLCAAANLRGSEGGYIKANTPIESVRKELQAAVVDSGPELVTTHPQQSSAAQVVDTQAIYEARRRAAAAANGETTRQ
jgi:signal peptide peptidase SppA